VLDEYDAGQGKRRQSLVFRRNSARLMVGPWSTRQ
jgi:hypothetical protein